MICTSKFTGDDSMMKVCNNFRAAFLAVELGMFFNVRDKKKVKMNIYK